MEFNYLIVEAEISYLMLQHVTDSKVYSARDRKRLLVGWQDNLKKVLETIVTLPVEVV